MQCRIRRDGDTQRPSRAISRIAEKRLEAVVFSHAVRLRPASANGRIRRFAKRETTERSHATTPICLEWPAFAGRAMTAEARSGPQPHPGEIALHAGTIDGVIDHPAIIHRDSAAKHQRDNRQVVGNDLLKTIY